MQVRKQQLELDMEQTGSQSTKKYVKAVLSSCLFNLYAETDRRPCSPERPSYGAQMTAVDGRTEQWGAGLLLYRGGWEPQEVRPSGRTSQEEGTACAKPWGLQGLDEHKPGEDIL